MVTTFLVLTWCAGTMAAPGADLYRMQTVVTGQGEANRMIGFATCLEDVLIKVSGAQKLAGDRRLAAYKSGAGSYVRAFSYHDQFSGKPIRDEQGTRDRPYDLIVSFDRTKIDAALRALGREPWVAPRPRLAVFLAMRNLTSAFVVAGDGERALERSALTAAAAQLGMTIALPSEAALAEAGLRFETFPTADPARLAAMVTATGGELALLGRMVWSDDALAWIADWRLAAGDRTTQWQARNVTFDEGFREAMGGAARILSGSGAPE